MLCNFYYHSCVILIWICLFTIVIFCSVLKTKYIAVFLLFFLILFVSC